jgi:uncharacterized protein YjbI with pentapeptide repeats
MDPEGDESSAAARVMVVGSVPVAVSVNSPDESRAAKFFKVWATPISIFLATVGFIFSVYQFTSQQAANVAQQAASQAQALDQQRQTTLSSYLDDMSSLLLTYGLGTAKPGSSVLALATARTDTALRNLDGNRKGTLVRFLWEANLINNRHPVIDLFEVNLSSAVFAGANLYQVKLSTDNLSRANFAYAVLNDANLSQADLEQANLHGADLRGADLSQANLSCSNLGSGVIVECNGVAGANLVGADLTGANLTGADLVGADLSNSELFGAVVTKNQLAQVSSLKGAEMPDGSIHT